MDGEEKEIGGGGAYGGEAAGGEVVFGVVVSSAAATESLVWGWVHWCGGEGGMRERMCLLGLGVGGWWETGF